MQADRLVLSSCFDPYWNLAVEDFLFRSLEPGRRLLFFWRNDPTVVIGRYQNPWLECRLDELERDGVHLARRQSGGGTVYHDRGNLCVTFMGPRAGFDRVGNMRAIQMTLHDAGFPVAVNDRNDLLMEGRKISGSAYRETADRSFHHATLLFTADLDRLDRYLKPRAKFQRAKGVASVRSPVARLADLDPSYLMEDFITAFAARTAPDKPVKAFSEEDATGHPEIAEQRKRWKAWDWVFGASPDFTVALGSGEDRFEVEVRGGKYRLSTEEKNFTPQALAADLAADARGLAENGRADAAARVRSWAEEAAAL